MGVGLPESPKASTVREASIELYCKKRPLCRHSRLRKLKETSSQKSKPISLFTKLIIKLRTQPGPCNLVSLGCASKKRWSPVFARFLPRYMWPPIIQSQNHPVPSSFHGTGPCPRSSGCKLCRLKVVSIDPRADGNAERVPWEGFIDIWYRFYGCFRLFRPHLFSKFSSYSDL